MNDNAMNLREDECKHEPATVELADGTRVPRYGAMPYGGLPAAGEAKQDRKEH
ncbi:hypothetical protein AEMCBJ_04295 [Cupriavidus necator]|uniref:hypothetical protein n=1 Tax=Cupriavidus necator TaxID=106590 RepID=UPI003F73459A